MTFVDQSEPQTETASESRSSLNPNAFKPDERNSADTQQPIVEDQNVSANREANIKPRELAEHPLNRSEGWMIGLTAVIAIGGAVSAVIFGIQLHEMKVAAELTRKSIELSETALNQARETMIASQRPWLSLNAELVGPLVWKDGGMKLQIRVAVKNTGLTPALHSRIFAILDPTDGRKGSEFCSTQRSRDSGMFGNTVFPGTTLTSVESIDVSAEETRAGTLKAGTLEPSLTICVDYRA